LLSRFVTSPNNVTLTALRADAVLDVGQCASTDTITALVAAEADDRPGVVGGCGYVADMRRRAPGTTGQYQASCEHGHCELTGSQAPQDRVRNLRYLITCLVAVNATGVSEFGCSVQIDMIFTLSDDRALMVEYGAQCIVARKTRLARIMHDRRRMAGP
jgi:hypothetical protein